MKRIKSNELNRYFEIGVENYWLVNDNGRLERIENPQWKIMIPILFFSINNVPEICIRPGANEGYIVSVKVYEDQYCNRVLGDLNFKVFTCDVIKSLVSKLLI